jgi:hypothetical protein
MNKNIKRVEDLAVADLNAFPAWDIRIRTGF